MFISLDALYSLKSYLCPAGSAAIDSRRLRPKSVGGTLLIVTTECLRPPGCGAGELYKVARNACSRGDGPEPSPPRSERRRTWLAVIPLVHGGVGRECLRVSRGSRHGERRYGFSGESISKLCRGDEVWLISSSFSQFSDSSTTINGSWLLVLGACEDRRNLKKESMKKKIKTWNIALALQEKKT